MSRALHRGTGAGEGGTEYAIKDIEWDSPSCGTFLSLVSEGNISPLYITVTYYVDSSNGVLNGCVMM